MKKDNHDNVIARLTIIALLSAISFSVQQFLKDETIDVIGVNLALLVLSRVFFGTVLIIFIIYLGGLALEYTYFMDRRFRFYELFYDIGVFVFLVMLISTIFIVVLIKLFSLTGSEFLIQVLFILFIASITVSIIKPIRKKLDFIAHKLVKLIMDDK